jgi:hypothetical protein
MQSRLSVLKQIFLDYLMLYPPYRQDYRKSIFNAAKHSYETAKSYITGQKPVDDQLDEAVKKIARAINDAKEFIDIYNLIFKSRKKAETAKSLQSQFAWEESKLREHLHGLADVIVSELDETKDFENKVNQLEAEIEKQLKAINYCIETKQGKGLDEENMKLNNVILELAQLGIIKYINMAMSRRLLDYLPIPTLEELTSLGCAKSAYFNIPIYLQKIYGEILYANRFETRTTFKFDEFKQNARYKVEQAEKEKSADKPVQAPQAPEQQTPTQAGEPNSTENQEQTNTNGQNVSPPTPPDTQSKEGTPSNSGVFSNSKPTLAKSDNDILKNMTQESSASQQGPGLGASK